MASISAACFKRTINTYTQISYTNLIFIPKLATTWRILSFTPNVALLFMPLIFHLTPHSVAIYALAFVWHNVSEANITQTTARKLSAGMDC